MSKVIFLNGCGSSGKTSIASGIQYLSKELWLTFGIDTFISMLPLAKEDQYFSVVPGQNERGPITCVETKAKGNALFGTMPDFASLLAAKEHNIIIDEVLFGNERVEAYAKSLKGHTVYFIGVFCDLESMQEREILRRDRHHGLSNDQIDRVHIGFRPYDFKIDTTNISPFEAAKAILNYVENEADPKGFNSILKNSL